MAPILPDRALTDPFSMRHFIYKRTVGEYEFYSFGLDMHDDSGREVESRRADADGDIVFASIPSPPC